jgi:signal transduction histidine kinase
MKQIPGYLQRHRLANRRSRVSPNIHPGSSRAYWGAVQPPPLDLRSRKLRCVRRTHMKLPSIRLARVYVSALRKHLRRDGNASLEPALRLGRRTVALGLKTLDLARIHEHALATLLLPGALPGTKAGNARRAGIFFAEAHVPIEEHQRASGRMEADFVRLEADLGTRTQELAAADRRCQQEVARRKAMEEANEKRRVLHKECLDESLQLQKRLRRLTHRILAAQENDRKTISQELENKIAQTLLGINVRLVTLQKEARGRTKRFKKDIASTQQAVVASADIVRRAARKLVTHEPQAPDLVEPLPGGVDKPPQRGRPGKPGGGAGAGQ